MPQSLQARVAGRGYPVFDAAGQSGQGHLPDSTLPSGPPVGSADPAWVNPANDPGWQPGTLGPPDALVMGGMFGLPGGWKLDDTPRTHAAPMADPTLPRGIDYIEADATHEPVFNGPEVRRDVGTVAQLGGFAQQLAEGNGQVILAGGIPGQLRGNAPFDAVQGYGGGGKGPGGTNLPELTTLDRQFPGETYHNVFVSAAEVPRYDVAALQFIPSDLAQAPWVGGNYDAPTASTAPQGITPADTPDQGTPWTTAASASSFWGG